MGRIIIPAEDLARCDHTDRGIGFMLAKRSRLDRRCVRAQQDLRRDIERVLHITGRMILWQVQAFKVVVVLLDFRSFFD